MPVTHRLPFCLLACCTILCSGNAAAQPTENKEQTATRTEKPAAVSWPRFVIRAAALGAHRSIYDLSVWGGGAELSLGGEREMYGLYYNVRVIRGETKAGLTVTESTLFCSFEVRVSGVRVGVGAGPVLVSVARITTSSSIDGLGLGILGRVGYDFAEPTGVFVLMQIESQTQHNWGPTLYAGYRF